MVETNRAESRDYYNLEKMVRSFSRREIESFTVPELGQVEVEGKKFFVVEYMQTLGYGDNVSVFPDQQKKQAFIEMIQTHGGGRKIIEYHTHTVATGNHWHDKFSHSDFNTISGMLNRNPEYIHVLFTPINILTLATSPTAFRLARVGDEARKVTTDQFMKWKDIFSSFLTQ